MDDRGIAITTFLASAGWANAKRRPLAGDASARRYERLRLGDKTAVLMDSPPGSGDNPADFAKIARHLRNLGLSAPAILAQDLLQGLLLLEDFGDATFARVLAQAPPSEQSLYELACDVLVHLQSHPAPADLPDLSGADWADAAMLSVEWYRFAITGDRVDPAGLKALLVDSIQTAADGPRVLILRDYHAENLMLLSERAGLSRAGLLDFQLAQMGQPGYDLVSLLQDARRDVTPEIEVTMIARFCAETGRDPIGFAQSYAVLGVQRALRILGVFARLGLVDGKSGYLALLPRVWDQLQRNLNRLDNVRLTSLCRQLLPIPNTANLEAILQKCVLSTPP